MNQNFSININFSLTILVTLFLFSCANIIAPTGGPRDERPPQLIENQSTKNYQTNFAKKGFELTFDEWVQLKNVFNQVLVSPPLEFRPEVSLKKRTVLFEFDEEEKLRGDATYIINFGKAITDLTENNPADIVFVFSTGDYIDSLKVEGNIIDAETGNPVADVLCLAYDNLADSVFRTERPFYFGRTDSEGHFEIQNMKSDTFKITALIDGNLNYLFDNPNEKIAFLDSTILVNDSVDNNLTLKLFQEELPLFLKDDENENYGLAKLIFNKKPISAKVSFDDFGQYVFQEIDKDTLKIWYDIPLENQYILKEKERDSIRVVFDAPEELIWNLYVQMDTIFDTIQIKKNVKTDFASNNKLTLISKSIPNFHPKSHLKIEFNHPIFSVDTNYVFIQQDSFILNAFPSFSVDSVEERNLVVNKNWKENASYKINFLPGSVIDQFGLFNQDTIVFSQKIAGLEDFGNLILKFIDLKKDTNYFVQLLDGGNGKTIEEFLISNQTNFEKNVNTLPPGNYKLRMIEDLDKNGKWSTGNYDQNRQPERIMEVEIEEIRANWDVESEISATNFSRAAPKKSLTPKSKSPETTQPKTKKSRQE